MTRYRGELEAKQGEEVGVTLDMDWRWLALQGLGFRVKRLGFRVAVVCGSLTG